MHLISQKKSSSTHPFIDWSVFGGGGEDTNCSDTTITDHNLICQTERGPQFWGLEGFNFCETAA